MTFKKRHKINVGRKFPPMTKKHRQKISEALTGRKIPKDVRMKMGISKKTSKNPNWSGIRVGYIALHQWLYRNYGVPDKCEIKNCVYPKQGSSYLITRPTFQWANVTGVYSRERKNWKMMCRSCHAKFDHPKNRGLRATCNR
jgi:hypothetical protein